MSAPARFFDALWFDGRNAQAQPARLELHGDMLGVELTAAGHALERVALRDVDVSERLDRAPRVLALPDGSSLQLDESDALADALAQAGLPPRRVERWQRAWPAAVLALVVLAACSVWVYRVGVPQAARWAAERVPPALEVRMGHEVLKALDRGGLVPSRLPPARQQALRERFAQLVKAVAPELSVRLEFRGEAEGDGINAFALPGGVVVLLDGMVTLAGADDELVLAVLAHELGHHRHRHMTSGLFEAAGSVALAGLIWGDYSSVASNAAAIAGVLGHTRAREEEADEFAFRALRRVGVSPVALTRFFEKVERRYGDRLPPSWLSTHPDPAERSVRALEASLESEPAQAGEKR